MTTQRIRNGAIGGLVGGLVFGMMMGVMGMLPMIGKLIGLPTVIAGLFLHLGISVLLGVTYSLLAGHLFSTWRSGLVGGMAYGVTWWVLGPLTLMPLLMGKGLAAVWNMDLAVQMLPSLFGHLMYGMLLGLTRALMSVAIKVTTIPAGLHRNEIHTISSRAS